MLSFLFGVLTLGIALFASYELWMVFSFWRLRKHLNAPFIELENSQTDVAPSVLVQLPVFNEPQVVAQLIETVARLDYPESALSIQILDDSTDETSCIISEALSNLPKAKTALFTHIQRDNREGFKAGALAHGMTLNTSEFVAIFDADFLPPEGFLRHAILEADVFNDPEVGFVQGRWTFYNRDESVFSQVQSILIDRHFLVQKPFQIAMGVNIVFNGSGGIWRRTEIEKSGGWLSRTLCEDLDLTLRSTLRGSRGIYMPSLECPNEVPRELQAFKMQQRRWAMGSAQTMLHLFPSVLRHGNFVVRANNLFSLAGYLVHPLLLFYAILWPILVLNGTNLTYLWACQIALLLGNLAAILGLVTTYKETGVTGSKRHAALQVGLSMALGVSMMINNTIAFASGLRGRGGVFARTPKAGADQKTNNSGTALPLHWSIILEACMAIYALIAAGMMLWQGFIMEFQQTFFFGSLMFGLVAYQLYMAVQSSLRRTSVLKHS